MNQQVINKVDIFNDSPKYIDGVVNANDRHRMYDIAIAVYDNNESIKDTEQYLTDNLSTEFLYRDKVLQDCKQCIEVIVPFLQYYKQ